MFLKSPKAWTAFALLLGCLMAAPRLAGQAAPTQPVAAAPAEMPVVLNGKTLFSVRGVFAFPADARAKLISERIKDLSEDKTFRPIVISVADLEGISHLMARDEVVMIVTEQDAAAAGETRQKLADDNAQRIVAAMKEYRKQHSVKSLTLAAVYSVIGTIIIVLVLWLLAFVFSKVYRKLNSWRGSVIRPLRIQKFEVIPAARIVGFAVLVAQTLRLAISLIAVYVYLSVVLDFFPWTQGYAWVLVGYVVSPLRRVGTTVATNLPNLFFIAVIIVIAYYVTKVVRALFAEVDKGTITLPGFYPEWAEPTFKLVRFLILALTIVVIFPYFPGAESPAFKGVSIFLGVLFSLGSTSLVANAIAGIVLTYMRAFKIGDRVRIADTTGDIVERTLLVTRIRTTKNEEIAITNATVLSNHIVNFNTSVEREGLILHTIVTIGYDTPWRHVHQLLIEAALATRDVLHEPKPFVLQIALDDAYIQYEINAYTKLPNCMTETYSNLFGNILDAFSKAGIEIMSPQYTALRDGNQRVIPAEDLPKDYAAPALRVRVEEFTKEPKIDTEPKRE